MCQPPPPSGTVASGPHVDVFPLPCFIPTQHGNVPLSPTHGRHTWVVSARCRSPARALSHSFLHMACHGTPPPSSLLCSLEALEAVNCHRVFPFCFPLVRELSPTLKHADDPPCNQPPLFGHPECRISPSLSWFSTKASLSSPYPVSTPQLIVLPFWAAIRLPLGPLCCRATPPSLSATIATPTPPNTAGSSLLHHITIALPTHTLPFDVVLPGALLVVYGCPSH
jgi:hypothetical protein